MGIVERTAEVIDKVPGTKTASRAVQNFFGGSSYDNFQLLDWEHRVNLIPPTDGDTSLVLRKDPRIPIFLDWFKRIHRTSMIIGAPTEEFQGLTDKLTDRELAQVAFYGSSGYYSAGIIPGGLTVCELGNEEYSLIAMRHGGKDCEVGVGVYDLETRRVNVPDRLTKFDEFVGIIKIESWAPNIKLV